MLTIPLQTLARNTCCFLSAFWFKMLMVWKNVINVRGRECKEERKKGARTYTKIPFRSNDDMRYSI
jgi:hypothetical protein